MTGILGWNRLDNEYPDNSPIKAVSISSGNGKCLAEIFSFRPPDSLHSLNISEIQITENKARTINAFIQEYSLANISDLIYLITITINKEMSAIRSYKNATTKDFGSDVKNYAKDNEELQSVIKHYIDCPIDNGSLAEKASLMSISFVFSDQTKATKITNRLVLGDIMDRLRKSDGLDPSISLNWDKRETDFKYLTIRGLFNFFQLRGTESYIKKKVTIHRLIATLFQLADVNIGDTGEDVIKTSLKRTT